MGAAELPGEYDKPAAHFLNFFLPCDGSSGGSRGNYYAY